MMNSMLCRLFGRTSVLLLLPATCEYLVEGVLEDVGVVIQEPFLVLGIGMLDDRYEA